jgi:hypothetical protein
VAISADRQNWIVQRGQLIAASCTTGWTDWIHGELWLFPNGILRARTGLATTVAHGSSVTLAGDLPTRDFSDEEIENVVRAHRTNHWIPASDIVFASMRRGPLSSRLTVRLASGEQVKLLWLKREPARDELLCAFTSWNIVMK